MKKYIITTLVLICSFSAKAQFSNTDTLRAFINRWIRNSAVEAFQNLRLNTAMIGMTNFLDSAYGAQVRNFEAVNDTTARLVTIAYDTFSVFLRGNGITALRRRPGTDSVEYLKNGTGWLFAYTDSTGGGGITDGDKGDITVSSSGSVWTVDNNAITNAKLAQAAALTVKGNPTNSTANLQDIAAATDNQVLRRSGAAIGFGSINLASSDAVGSSILPVANGGTGTASPGLIAGTNIAITGTWPNQNVSEGGPPKGITRTLITGNIDSSETLQFGAPNTGFVQSVSGDDHIGTPMTIYPYGSNDTNKVNPRPIKVFHTYTNQYDITQPLNTVTDLYRYGTYNLSDRLFRIAHEQNWYGGGEFHLAYKLDGMGSEIRLMSPTWDWKIPNLSTNTFRSGQFVFKQVLDNSPDTQMLAMTAQAAMFTQWLNAIPEFKIQQYSTDGTKGGFLMSTQSNQTYIDWHLNTVTPNNHSIVWDLPGSTILGAYRTSASGDPEWDHRFANLSNNRMMQWKRSTRIMGVLNSGASGNDHWVFGGEYTAQMSNAVNVKTYRSYLQKPFGVAITDAADVIIKAPISTDTAGRVRINVPNPNTAWSDPLLGVTETEDWAAWGKAIIIDNTAGLNRLLTLKNTDGGNFSGPSFKFFNNVGTGGTNGYGLEFYSNGTSSPFTNAMVYRNYEGGPHVFYGQSAELGRFNDNGHFLIGSTTDGSETFQMTGSAAFDLGSDATGDMYYRNSGGSFTRLGIGSTGNVLTVAGGLPSWSAASGGITSVNSMTGPAITITAGTGITTSSASNDVEISVDVNNSSLPHTIDKQFIDANNTGTGETDLYTKTVAANTLGSNGQSLSFEIGGAFNDATATANLQIYFAGTAFAGTGAMTISGTGAWRAQGSIVRVSSSVYRASVTVFSDNTTQKIFTSMANVTSVDFTASNIFKITGTAGGAGGGSNDITAQMMIITYNP
jgi:hypothetical protein